MNDPKVLEDLLRRMQNPLQGSSGLHDLGTGYHHVDMRDFTTPDAAMDKIVPSAEYLARTQQQQREGGVDAPNDASYVFDKTVIAGIPRWPGDTIEQRYKESKANHHCQTPNPCPRQRELTQLLGGWECTKMLRDMDEDTQDMVLSIPRQTLQMGAQKESSLTAAEDYLFAMRSDPSVQDLLERSGAKPLIKHRATFPGVRMVLTSLAHARLACDSNLGTMFGDAAYVRCLMLEVGNLVADPPDPSSPAGRMFPEALSPGLIQGLPRFCEHCSKSSAACSLSKCSGCVTSRSYVLYCSPECQKADWRIHKPDCQRANGVEPSRETVEKAQKAKQKIVDAEKAQKEAAQQAVESEQQQFHELMAREYDAFVHGGPHVRKKLHDCERRPCRQDIPECAKNILSDACRVVGLEHVGATRIPLPPAGVQECDVGGGRCVRMRNRETGGDILLMYKMVFINGGVGDADGWSIRELCVVEASGKPGTDTKWAQVPRPTAVNGVPTKWGWAVLLEWLRLGKAQAVHKTKDLFKH